MRLFQPYLRYPFPDSNIVAGRRFPAFRTSIRMIANSRLSNVPKMPRPTRYLSLIQRIDHLGRWRHFRFFSSSPSKSAGDVKIVEVGPRDGLQNEKTSISLETKLELIRRLAQTGVGNMEAGSFVAPRWVPQVYI